MPSISKAISHYLVSVDLQEYDRIRSSNRVRTIRINDKTGSLEGIAPNDSVHFYVEPSSMNLMSPSNRMQYQRQLERVVTEVEMLGSKRIIRFRN